MACERAYLHHGAAPVLSSTEVRPAGVRRAIEHTLPGAVIEPTSGNGDDDFVAERERTKMRRGVVLAGTAVVAIGIGLPRRDALLEPVEDVGPQPRLVVVHEDGCR